MIWQRSFCDKEVNMMPGAGGLLMMSDAMTTDLSPFYGTVQCVYLDPPYYTKDRFSIKIRIGKEGWAAGKRTLTMPAYDDFPGASKETYLSFLRGIITLSHQLLTEEGSFFLHLDYRASAHARLLCDEIFGESNFVNEIVWSYQTGGRSKQYFSRKHDNILYYGKSADRYFDITQVPSRKKKDHNNHMKRQVDEKGRSYRSIQSGGKTYTYYDDEPSYPDDVWTDVSQMQQRDSQRTGYPTQKPQMLLDRIIRCCTKENDLVADFMCGSGTTLVSASENNRRFLGLDASAHAFSVSRKRLQRTALSALAPLSDVSAMVDASVLPGIGFYDVDLNAYTLPANAFEGLTTSPKGMAIHGLDAVDQWYAGLLIGTTFHVYASAARTKQNPSLPQTLKVPLLKGTVGIMMIDVLGKRSFWTASPQV